MGERDDGPVLDDDADDLAEDDSIEQLEMLETIIQYMEELGVMTLTEARERYAALERALGD